MGDVFSQTNSEQCIVIETLTCSPYNISVMAHNKVGGSLLTWNSTDDKEGNNSYQEYTDSIIIYLRYRWRLLFMCSHKE